MFKRLIAMLLILALFAGDLGCNSFMALAAYADDAASAERKELTQIEQEESAEAEPAAEETEITEEDSAAEETENTEEDSAVEETENAEKESAAEEAEEEKIAAEEEPSRMSKAKTVKSTESAAEEPLADVDFNFASRTVSLTEILDALGITAENNAKLRVDSALVELSETTVKNKNRDSITLTALDYFDCVVLTIEKKTSRTITLAYPRPAGSEQSGEEPEPAEGEKPEDMETVNYLPEDAIWANDVLYLTGKMPANAVVEATPVTVEIDGAIVVAAYDIKIYVNANQQKKAKT